MNKLTKAVTFGTVAIAGLAAPLTANAWHHHGWGRGGCHFWPGFVGGVVGGAIYHSFARPVVYTTPAYTTPVYTTPVVTQPVVVQQPTIIQQPAPQVQQQVIPVETVRVAEEKEPAQPKLIKANDNNWYILTASNTLERVTVRQ